MEINVIWVDDQCRDSSGFAKPFIDRCKIRFGIKLYPFELVTDAISALENNIDNFQAVILDAKGWHDKKYTATNTYGMHEAIKKIISLSYKKIIPYYILTAQSDLLSSEEFENSVGKNRVFYKYNQDDVNRLLESIVKDARKESRNQIRFYYSDAINQLCSLNVESGDIVLTVLEAMHYPDKYPDFKPVLYYNQLRQILEYNFRLANKVYIIPDDCFDDNGDPILGECSRYINGRDTKYTKIKIRYGQEGDRIVPSHIEQLIRMVLEIGNINSHSNKLNDKELQELEQYFKKSVFNSRYLIYSLALNVCEITLWFKNYINSHQDIEKNKKMRRQILENQSMSKDLDDVSIKEEELVGIVKCDNGIYHIGDKFFVNSKTIEDRNLLNKKVKIVQYDNNTRPKIKETFPLFACRVEPV